MADLVITAANVKPGTGMQKTVGVAGEALTAGQSVFLDTTAGSPTQNKWIKGDSNDGTRNKCGGICMNSPAAGQSCVIATAGEIDIGATLTVGELYILSGTPGGVAPKADAASGMRIIVLAVALAANRFKINLWDTTATM